MDIHEAPTAFQPPLEPAAPGAEYLAERPRRSSGAAKLLLIGLFGALVAVALGVYGRQHQPTGRPLALVVGFTAMTPMKAWLATFAIALVVFQVVSAMGMWGKLPISRPAPAWLSQAHRWSGSVAFLLTLPVAYHCLWSLGFSTFDTRTALHSIFGCAFYGAFATKMLGLRVKGLPGWSLPVLGGLLFAALIGAWATGAVWYFTQPGVPLR